MGKLSDLAGTWRMSDEEVGEFMTYLKNGWKNFKIKNLDIN